ACKDVEARKTTLAAPASFWRWFGANKRLLSLGTLPRRMLATHFRLFHHLVQRCVDHLRARSARPLVTDHSLVVDHIERRRGGEVPLRRDRSRTGVASVDKERQVICCLSITALSCFALRPPMWTPMRAKGLAFSFVTSDRS